MLQLNPIQMTFRCMDQLHSSARMTIAENIKTLDNVHMGEDSERGTPRGALCSKGKTMNEEERREKEAT